jgi:hypothetical protein
MRNVEQIEHELTQFKGKEVSLVVPLGGSISYSTFGTLHVVEYEHRVAFHIPSVAFAIIFLAEDVDSIEPPHTEPFIRTIRLLKRA